VLEFAVEPYELLYYKEGLSSVVTVARAFGSKNIWLANNGKVDASTQIDMPTQVLCAHLPYIFQPEAKDVLVIGLASGITAGSVSLHSSPTSIEVIELEPAIVEASHYFDDYNHHVLGDPRVKLIANDGRNHLFLQPDGRYDLIVSEPSNPWLTGVSNLFTYEFFLMGKSKLKKGGVWSQWVQLYGMDKEDFRSLLRTFTEAYKYVHLFSTIEDADVVMVGSDEPLILNADSIARIMNMDAAVAQDLQILDIHEPEDLLLRYQANEVKIRDLAGSAPINTDDNMRIEYSAPLNLHRDTSEDNMLLMMDTWQTRKYIPFEAVEGVEGMIALAQAYARKEDWLKATITLDKARKEDPENELIFELFPVYQANLRAELEGAEGDTPKPDPELLGTGTPTPTPTDGEKDPFEGGTP